MMLNSLKVAPTMKQETSSIKREPGTLPRYKRGADDEFDEILASARVNKAARQSKKPAETVDLTD